MTFEEFDKLFEALVADSRLMRDSKGQEYCMVGTTAPEKVDRLHNFKEIANYLGLVTIGDVAKALSELGELDYDTPDQLKKAILAKLKPNPLAVWGVYWLKHVFSVINYVKSGGETKSNESIRSRFVDISTYNSLGMGIILDSTWNPEKPREGFFRCSYCGSELTLNWLNSPCPQCKWTNIDAPK